MGRARKEAERLVILDGAISIFLPEDGCMFSDSCFTCVVPDECVYDEYREQLRRKEMKAKILES